MSPRPRARPRSEATEIVAGLEVTEEEAEEVREQTQRATERTRRGFFSRLGGIFERADFDDALWDDLEEVLLASDAGLQTTTDVLEAVRRRVKDEGAKQSARVREILREELIAILELPGEEPPAWARPDAPPLLIVLVVGVNGAGKTTSIAKLSHAFKRDGAAVVLGAADTFRAAATDQLKVWGERIGVPRGRPQVRRRPRRRRLRRAQRRRRRAAQTSSSSIPPAACTPRPT